MSFIRDRTAAIQRTIEILDSMKNRYGPKDRAKKLRTLRQLLRQDIRNIRSVIKYHEALCFLRAYPDSPDVLRLAEEALAGFAARVDRLKASCRPLDLKKLRDTGIAHTTTYYPYPHAMAKWLVESFPGDVELDWEDEEGLDKIRSILPFVVAYPENDALDDEQISLRDWVRAAKGDRRGSDLEWLLEALNGSSLPSDGARTLYDGAELLVGWELREATNSRTLAKFPTQRIFYHKELLSRAQVDFLREVQKPLLGLKRVSTATGKLLIHLFRAAVSLRNRELYPLLYSNPQDVWLADLERGIRIALVGVLPEARLPLESHYSHLILKNGIPIGYGGGSALFDSLELAGNIFESFRQGESAYIFSQVYRTFFHLCGAPYLLVPRYQVGYENEEALQSGAFWFYHKLGFRPEDPLVLALAQQEQEKIQADPTYRSPREILRKLAQSDMSLTLNTESSTDFRILEPGTLGLLVTQHITRNFHGDRKAAVRAARRTVIRALGISGWQRWSAPEQMALERLSPILVLIPDLPRWTPAEKRALVRIIKAKGGRREAAYIGLLREHHRLARSLRELANSATLPMSPGHSPGV